MEEVKQGETAGSPFFEVTDFSGDKLRVTPSTWDATVPGIYLITPTAGVFVSAYAAGQMMESIKEQLEYIEDEVQRELER